MLDLYPMSTSYQTVNDWKIRNTAAHSPMWKCILYDLIRPSLSLWTRRCLTADTLKTLDPSLVLPERGFPINTRRRWATNYESLHGKTILVQGTGTGWDVISWAELSPTKIIATDLFSFAESWNEIRAYCQHHFGVEVCFHQASLEDLAFLEDDSVDLCASDNVYEHCRDLHAVMMETRRVLKSNGYVYAAYGPLWFCASGDHFGRGGLNNAYNHLIMDEIAYKNFIRSYEKDHEEFQSGSRYIEIGLFSYLTTSEYLDTYKKTGFVLDELILDVSSQALDFREQFPERFAELERKYAGRSRSDDFLIKSNLVRLRKK
jgi:SAM-dependent methyltransferase